jgi:serine/threonine protein kinase
MLLRNLAAGVLAFSPLAQSLTIPETESLRLDTHLDKRAADQGCGKFYKVEIGQKLGEGSYGKVYMAKAHASKVRPAKSVALKIAKQSPERVLKGAQIAEERFSESSTMMKVYTSCQHGNSTWVLSELLDPENELFHRITQGYYENYPKEIPTAASSIITGLSYMHSKRYCYNDLKPENLIGDGAAVKYVDFDMLSKGTPTHVCGTTDYMSPGKSCLRLRG